MNNNRPPASNFQKSERETGSQVSLALTGRKKTRFSYLRSSVLPLRNNTNFAVYTPANFSTPHTKFERNRFKRSRDIRLQIFLTLEVNFKKYT